MSDLIPQTISDYLYTLAEDVVEYRVSEQFTDLTFLKEPVPFNEAPEDELLMVVGDYLTGCKDLDYGLPNFGLLKGSIFTKVSDNFRDVAELDSTYHLTEQQGLLLLENAYVRVREPKPKSLIRTVSHSVYSYNTSAISNCYVIPISQVLSKGVPLFGAYIFYSGYRGMNRQVQAI